MGAIGIGLGLTMLRGGGGGDTTAPTVTITCAQSSPTVASPINLTFTLSENSTDFTINSITIGGTANGVKGNFAGSGSSYTCDVTPANSGTITVDVAAGAFHDAANNANLVATQFTITFMAFLLRDEFTTTEAAPMVSPRTCEPGPGTLTLTDTGSKLATSNGNLVISGLTVSNSDPRFDGTLAYAAGRCVGYFGLRLVSGAPNNSNVRPSVRTNYNIIVPLGTNLQVLDAGGGPSNVIQTISADTDYNVKIIANPSHTFVVLGNKLMFPMHNQISNMNPRYMVGNAISANMLLASLRAVDLIAPWTTSYGVATGHTTSPASGATLTHEANGFVDFRWTPSAGQVLELWLRRTDDNNGWIVRCDQAGGTIKLIEKNAGVETERGSAAQTWTAGTNYRVVALAEGNTIITYAGTVASGFVSVKNTYTSATFNNTATGALVSGFTTGTDFATWPRTLSGTALTVINAINP